MNALHYISFSFRQLDNQWSISYQKCFCENSFSDESDFNNSERVLKHSAATFPKAEVNQNTYNDSKEKG